MSTGDLAVPQPQQQQLLLLLHVVQRLGYQQV